MTKEEINHELALFDGWRLAKIGTYYYKGEHGADDFKLIPIGNLDYHTDWNLAHSVWIKFIDARAPKDEMIKYWRYINSLSNSILSNETPQEFVVRLHKAIQWYKNLNQ